MDAESSSTDRPGPTPEAGYRLVVLGGGLAGPAAAREAARRGVRVALILPADDCAESSPPTQLPLAHLTEQIRRLQIRTGQTAATEAPREPGVDVYRGRPVFCQRHAVTVEGREIPFRKALVATGTEPVPAAVDNADQCDCLRVETLAQLTELPRRLAVIGCGPEACGWAQAFRRLGSRVHLIDRRPNILPEEEPDAAGLLRTRLEQDGIRLHFGCGELAVETTGNLQAIVIEREGRREKLLVDRVLLCESRQPHTAGLGLESAGVAYTDHGIVVGDRLQTTNRRVFAAGGVCGARWATPQAAEATARLAVHNALSLSGRRLSRLVIPRCIYTDPAIAQVGLTRREAADGQIEIDTYRTDLPQGNRDILDRHRQGLVAVHVRRRTGLIAGATVVGEAADELIAPLVLLMTRRLSLEALADVIASSPSRFELLTRLGERYRQARRSRLGVGLVERWKRRRRRKGGA